MPNSIDGAALADLLFLKDQSCADALSMMMADVTAGCSELFDAAEHPLHVVLVQSALASDQSLWRYRVMLVSLNEETPTEVRVAGYSRLVPSESSGAQLGGQHAVGLTWEDVRHIDSADSASALEAFLRALPLSVRPVRVDARTPNVFWSHFLEAVATALDPSESKDLDLAAYCLEPRECEIRGLHRVGSTLGGRGA